MIMRNLNKFMVGMLLLAVFASNAEANTALEIDSTGVFTCNIVEPVVSLISPDSLKTRKRIMDEQAVFAHHQDVLNELTLEVSPSLPDIATTSSESYSVGRIQISSTISPSGGRIYNIPVQVAAGWTSVPQVALCYNSQSGNDVAGYGWGISGLSSIELRNKNYYYDNGVSHSVYDSSESVYALDGVPIVASALDVNGYEYATAKGNILIKKHFTSTGVLSYFTVLFPDGSQGTFGNRTNSLWRTSYPLTEIKDIDGNIITYNYGLWSGHYYVTSISYGNDASIVFSYESRSDIGQARYKGGYSYAFPNMRLSSIISKDGDTEICRYTLTYSYMDDVSLLREVNCVSGNSSYKPLEFTYGIDSIYDDVECFDMVESNSLGKYYTQTDNLDVVYKRGKFIPESFIDGIIHFPEFIDYAPIDSKYHWLTKCDKYGSTCHKDQVILFNPTMLDSSSQIEIVAGEGFQSLDAVDVDGDGVEELVKINNGCTVQDVTNFKVEVISFNEEGLEDVYSFFSFDINDGTHNPCFINPAKCFYYYGDFRGNGREMLLVVTKNRSRFALVDLYSMSKVSEISLFSMTDVDPNLLFIADFENDGQDDVCYITDEGMDVYSLSSETGSVFSKRKTYSGISKSALWMEPVYKVNGIPSECPGHIYPIDINGDGYCDVAAAPYINKTVNDIVINSPTWNIAMFNGKSFITQNHTLYTRLEKDKIDFMDVDDDGLPDMLHTQNGRVYLIPNVDGTFLRQNTYTNIELPGQNAELIPCDYSWYGGRNGEIMTVNGYMINIYDFKVNHEKNRLLTNVLDSFGIYHSNKYGNISKYDGSYLIDDSRVYDCNEGYMRMYFPLTVLKESYVTGSGREVSFERYTYYDACLHSKGLGFCGFGKLITTDLKDDVVSTVENNPEKMCIQEHASLSLLSSWDSPFEETVYTYDDNFTTFGKSNPRLVNSVSTDYLTGLTTTTSIIYDEYDFPISTTIEKTLGDGKTHTEKQSNVYDHHVADDKYILGTVRTSSVHKNGVDSLDTGFWLQRSVMTYDDSCRPLTRKDYVSNYGEVTYPTLLGIDGMITNRPGGIPIDSTLFDRPSNPSINTNREGYLVCETRWEYDAFGNVISEKSAPYGATTFTGSTFTYDTVGRFLTSSTNSLGHTVTYSDYNKFGRPTMETDHLGRVTSYTYDDWGNLIETLYSDGSVARTTLSWGGEGLYTMQKTMTGAPSEIIHFDCLGREVRSGTLRFDTRWQYIDKEYDDKGRLYKESLPFKGNSAVYWDEITYDDYGRKTSVIRSSGNQTTLTYNASSVTTYQNGIASTKTYDAGGNLVSVADAGGVMTYSLRDDGQPLSVTLSGGIMTTFSYDRYGRRNSIVDPSAGIQTEDVVYNDDGSSVLTHVNPNGTIITYTDRFGRKTKVERPGEYTTDYTYDSNGLLVSEVSSNGTSNVYTYDAYDRVVSLTETVPDGKWLKKTYTYNVGGTISSVAYESQSGPICTESYTYAYGHVQRIGVGSLHVRLITGENMLGQPATVRTGNLTRTYSYTPYGMPIRRTMGSVMDYSYSFDPLTGNLVNRTDNIRNQTEIFEYDDLNRLISIDDREISYADNGNIISIDGVGDISYDNADRPYQVTSLTLEDDVVSSDVQSVAYTCYSRPSIISEGNKSTAFTYNGNGERVKMYVSVNGLPVLSRYYIGNQYEVDMSTSGIIQRLYLGGDAYSAPAVYIKEGSGAWTFYNIGRDYLGNITHIATEDGTLVEENSYDPWGRLRNPETKEIYSLGTEPELMLGRGYTGHEHLTWFGLINMNARLYDPVLGRFLSPDPFVQMPDFTQNFNRYSYCLNNPLVYVDENGEFWHIVIGAVIGGVSNWISNGCEFSWRGLGYFGVGAGIGALSAITGGALAGITQAAGVFAGAGIGALTGAATGGTSSLLLNGGNNLIEGNNFFQGWDKALTSGAIGGALSGACSGAVQGYRYSKERGFNPWTNKKITYESPVKNGATVQPNPEAYCYADALEYADIGHNNTPMERFVELTGSSPGGDVMIYKKLYPNVSTNRYSTLDDDLLQQLLESVPLGDEVMTTISAGDQLHWINLIGTRQGFKLNSFGGGMKQFLEYKVWDSNSGVRYFMNNIFSNITVFNF